MKRKADEKYFDLNVRNSNTKKIRVENDNDDGMQRYIFERIISYVRCFVF
jgi:hypothetical protein